MFRTSVSSLAESRNRDSSFSLHPLTVVSHLKLPQASFLWLLVFSLLFIILSPVLATAQTATYHLHKEASSTLGLFQLKTAGPDAASFAIQSADLKNLGAGDYILKEFDTQSGVPNKAGTIPAGSTANFTLWMKKTANYGTLYPRAKLNVNSSAGSSICTATGTTALTTTLTKYTLTCSNTGAVSMTASDRYYLWVGVNVTAGPGNHTMKGELDVEGTLNGNYDSMIVVTLPNASPTVNITTPSNNATFVAGSNVTINANASDSDGSITKVEFFQGSTKLGEDLSSPYSYTWVSVAAGNYSLTAKATDNQGAITTSSPIAIIVNSNISPTVSITSPANNATFTAPASVTINATASDSDGTVTKVEFFQGGTKLGEDTTSPYSFLWSSVSTGNYSLTAKATDNVGGNTTSTPVNITVSTANSPPSVSISSPSNNATFLAPAMVTINAIASDTDGNINRVEFLKNGELLGQDTSSPYSFDWSSVAAGSYSLTARAFDNGGASATSAAVSITVTGAIGFASGTPAKEYIYSGNKLLVVEEQSVALATGPIAPSNLTATAQPAGQIQLSWSDNSSDEFGFYVEKSSDGVNFVQIDIVQSNVTTYLVSGLLPGTTYTFQIRAFNATGNSAYSNLASAQGGGGTGPAGPTGLRASLVSTTQVNLTWIDNSNNEEGYKIEQSTDGINFSDLATLAASTTSYMANGLLSSTTYTFRVRAYNSGGNSTYAVIAAAPTGTGNGLRGEYYSTQNLSSLQFTRIDPAINFNYGYGSPDPSIPTDRFSIRWCGQVQPRFSETYTFFSNANSGSRLWVNGQLIIAHWTELFGEFAGQVPLVAGQKYDIQLEYNAGIYEAYAVLSWSSLSQPKEVIPQSQIYATAVNTIPVGPGDLRASVISAAQADLRWSDNSDNEVGFKVERSSDGTNFAEIASLGTNQSTYSATSLSAGTTYTFRVRAFNSNGNSPFISIKVAPAGTGSGLKGEYFANQDLTNLGLTRTDATVNFNWGYGSPDPSIPTDRFSIRWSGQVEPKYSEAYTLFANVNSGVRFWINDLLIIDHWNDLFGEFSGSFFMEAGQKYDVRMEYNATIYEAYAVLSWSSLSQPKEVIPQSQLYPIGGGALCITALPPESFPPDTVWVDDQLPGGALPTSNWHWDPVVKASGTQAHTDPMGPGYHQHYFSNATATLTVSPSENLVAYVMLDPCNPPREVVLQWLDTSGSWEHRAFWGQELVSSVTQVTPGSPSYKPMGVLPQIGSWVRLEVPASYVGIGARNVMGMAYSIFDGRAWFDRAGKGAGTCVTAQTPSSLPSDTVWFDDQPPAGAIIYGTWFWDGTQKVSGTQSHTEPSAAGAHQHFFENSSQTLTINSGDKLVAYVLINPCDPPTEVMLQWRETNGSWEHRAFWGQDNLQWGTLNTPSRIWMSQGTPPSNQWIRLEVPASLVGLEGKTINGMAFTLNDGQAWFDRAGKTP